MHWLNKLSSWICVCNSALISNYLLQVLGWALTEYGDSLQSLVNTPSAWITNSFNVHSSVSDIVTKEASITLHYITDGFVIDHQQCRWVCYWSPTVQVGFLLITNSADGFVIDHQQCSCFCYWSPTVQVSVIDHQQCRWVWYWSSTV